MSVSPPLDSAWVALSLIPHLGARTLERLLARFGTPRAALAAPTAELRRVDGIGPALSAAIAAVDLARVEADIARWQASGVTVLTRADERYPLPLTLLPDPPPTLFVRGNLSQALWADAVAIVGTRQPSATALRAAQVFAARYAGSGYTVVSGLALGVDAAAHQAALQQANGRTAAVLGSGVLNVYPSVHRPLAEAVLERGGVLLCECSPDDTASARHLVARNRLITGLARFVLLIESGADGGAMHAVRFARQQSRPLYVCDLPASGNQQAIREGVDHVLRL